LSAIVSIAMLGAEMIIPLFVQNVRHATALESGLIMMPGAIAMMVASPLSGHLFDKYGIKLMSIVGLTITILATIPMIFFNAETSIWIISICYTVRMAGIGMVSMQLMTSGINALPKPLLVHGNSVLSTIRQAASSLGTALLVTVASVVTAHAKGTHTIAITLGYRWSFVVTTLITVIGLMISFKLRNKPTAEFEMSEISH
jgi:MFS family permease